MPTLTKASEETKEILKWGGLFIAGIFVFFVLLRIVLYVKDLFFPTPPPKPTVAFGFLPPQIFPENSTNAKLTYSLNTLTGDTPSLQNQTKVYQILQPQSDLLALSRTQDMVTPLGFNSKSTALSNRIFEWSTSDSKDIKIDIINHNFIFTYPYLSDPNVLSVTNLDTNQAILTAKNMLSIMQLFYSDIDLSKTKTVSYSISNNRLIPATSLSDTQIVQVSFIQNDFDNLPIYYDNPNSSSMTLLVSTDKVVGASFLHQSVSDQLATYPIKTSKQAYQELQQGKGYIASYGGSTSVTIRNIFLAYYMSGNLQQFLMPIFVFQGDNGFYAYVPAVTDVWISK
jgi:hypothetical protein